MNINKVLTLELVIIAAFAILSGCASVNEKHYMGAFTTATPDNPSGLVNVFRINIDGDAGLSNVRYIAGTYDERAIDFFLNEVKSDDYAPSDKLKFGKRLLNLTCPTKDDKPLSQEDCKKAYEDALTVSPLASDGSGGSFDSFVIIFSTNADAIAETIGAISENTVAIQSVNYLLNKDTYEEAAVINNLKSVKALSRKATVDTLSTLFSTAYAADPNNTDTLELNILRTIAIGLDPERNASFTTLDEAKIWFASLD